MESICTYSVYFDQDDREGIERWFREQPEGRWQIMVGVNRTLGTLESDVDVAVQLAMLAADVGMEVYQWSCHKIKSGELRLRACEKRSDISSGVPFVDITEGKRLEEREGGSTSSR